MFLREKVKKFEKKKRKKGRGLIKLLRSFTRTNIYEIMMAEECAFDVPVWRVKNCPMGLCIPLGRCAHCCLELEQLFIHPQETLTRSDSLTFFHGKKGRLMKLIRLKEPHTSLRMCIVVRSGLSLSHAPASSLSLMFLWGPPINTLVHPAGLSRNNFLGLLLPLCLEWSKQIAREKSYNPWASPT